MVVEPTPQKQEIPEAEKLSEEIFAEPSVEKVSISTFSFKNTLVKIAT